MALAKNPARCGQQWSFRRMRHVFGDAVARSPGPRSLAWDRLASFCPAGLFFPRYGVQTGSAAPWYPLSAKTIRPARSRARRMPQIRAALVSWALPGKAADTQTISPVGVAMTCRFIPCLWCSPEENGRSAATSSIGIKVPNSTTSAWPARAAGRSAACSLGARAASRSTVSSTYRRAVDVEMPNPAASSAKVSALRE